MQANSRADAHQPAAVFDLFQQIRRGGKLDPTKNLGNHSQIRIFGQHGISFYALGEAEPLLGIPKVDGLLLEWDRALVGETPAIVWEPWLRPWLEDMAMGGYLFFFYYLIAGPGHYCVHDVRLFRKCMVGLFTLYGVAFMGYTVLPAAGPHCWMTFATPLHGPMLLDWTLKPVNVASNSIDVFPSVHAAVSLYLLLFDWKHWRRRFWWVLAPCLLLWFATLYLRFHYMVDLLAGGVVALIGWGMAEVYGTATAEKPMLAIETNERNSAQIIIHTDVEVVKR
jgi:hypothetical protein